MNKTVTANISGQVFHIDEDAYQLLTRYLDNLQLYLRHDADAPQVMARIERRMATHFGSQLSPTSQVITLAHVEEVIALLGENGRYASDTPSSSSPHAAGTGSAPHQSSPESEAAPHAEAPHSGPDDLHSDQPSTTRPPKRLMRDGQNKIVGGVLSGLAAYMGTDATALRFLAILLSFIITGLPVIYLVLWIVCPLARTDAQRRTMYGLSPDEPLPREDQNFIVNTPLHIAGCLFKLLLILLILYLVFLFIVMPLIGIESIFCPHWSWISFCHTDIHLLLIASFLIMVGLPIGYIFRFIYCRVNHHPTSSSTSQTFWFVTWLLAICCFVYAVMNLC